jgi:hydrogenase nickel incorporation protein HypB
MCATCGCSSHVGPLPVDAPVEEPVHGHAHHEGDAKVEAPHEHVRPDGTRYLHRHSDAGEPHDHGAGMVVDLEAEILAKNNGLAAQNRLWLRERGILSLNLMGSPGAGKTALLERLIGAFGAVTAQSGRMLSVIEGDQATARDGDRIRKAGAPVAQLNTGTGCHLDADMVMQGLVELQPALGSVVIIENIGNLVCPALFDLGERRRVVVLSVAEGDDKPLKYPHMFRAADLVLLNKIDLLPYVEFDITRAADHARLANPDVRLLRISARTGEGLDEWYEWVRDELAQLAVSAREGSITA